jgi:membrane fusion protein, multidrug efflux system
MVLLLSVAPLASAAAQAPGGAPPAVGVVQAKRAATTQTNEFLGRIQAIERYNVLARVTGFLDKRYFREGAEVKKDDLLFKIEQPPFQADVAGKKATVDQLQAQLENARLTKQRAQTLITTPAGQQSTLDTAVASERALAAQVAAAEAALRQSEINFAYTEIHAPIDGRIGRTSITEGNVVGPTSGVLATIVSQDPVYVTFPVPVRTMLQLRERSGFNAAVVKIRLPDGRLYAQEGKLEFVDNTIASDTDTIILRGTLPNPRLNGSPTSPRELFDGEFVRVLFEDAQPVETISLPRAAILSDQEGDYVFVVGEQNKVEKRRLRLGQSTPSTAVVVSGLIEGESVVLEGLQRVKPGIVVTPGPASELPKSVVTAQ